jgi:hypothetical protein
VLAARLAADDHLAAAAVLLVIGGVSWAGLGYLLPPLLAGRGLSGASGSWFLWPVATKSVAVGLTSLPPPWPEGLVAVAVACWSGSGYLYRVTMLNTLAAARCLPDPGRVVAAVKRYKFQALVALNGEEPDARQLVTVRLAGDDVADYFSVGGHFDVWMGNDVGQGVITRRLFV